MRLRLALASLLGAVGLFASAPPAAANAPGAAICAVVGVMTFTPPDYVTWPPVFPGPGVWANTNVAFICVGFGTDALLPVLPAPPGIGSQMIGAAPFAAGGTTGPACGGPALGIFGQFCGTWTAGPFLTGATCAGGIGGPGPGVGEPLPPTVDADTDDWSLIAGNLIIGHIDCDTGPAMTATSTGVIALVAAPNPSDIGPFTGACAPPTPVAPPSFVWSCSLLVVGVAVLVDTTVI